MDQTRYFTRSIALLAALCCLAGVRAQAAEEGPPQEQKLIATLRSDSPKAEQAIACKQLAIHGTAQAVPALAPLLADAQLASWARIALEAIPGPEADAALRKAVASLSGELLVGTINSIGVRRDSAAVDTLTGRLKDSDAAVASAAAVALGHIANAAATQNLRQALASAPAGVRPAVAEGCILAAERLLADGKASQAAAIYDEVRRADLPKQKIIEATRGAILARKADGIPLLIEQLRSPDKGLFLIGLTTARELPGRAVAEALAGELASSSPQRAVLLLTALSESQSPVLPPAVVQAMKNGSKEVRIAAAEAVGQLGDAASLPALLEIATDADTDIAQAARSALADLPGEKVNAEIVTRLATAQGKTFAVLIELVGQKRLDATSALVKALGQDDPAVRSAALTALGETIGLDQLPVLIAAVAAPKNADDAKVARKALRAACVRMPQREECAAQLVAALAKAPVEMRPSLLEILGAMGGTKALETMVTAVKGSDAELQETASKLLGEWMTIDAAPALLDLTKTAPSDKYRGRALRGYIRIARQFIIPEGPRAEMCQHALDAAGRAEDQKLVLVVLERYPNADTLKVAAKAMQIPGLKEDASRTALAIVQKLGASSADLPALLATIGLAPMKVEIVKAEYGAGTSQKDVTAVIQQQVRDLPLISLPSTNYNASFGGDPAPGVVKLLKVQYRIDGKAAEASFAENAVIMLPMPK
ncbi:MAG TPA: HEAT repeat domain-containing protein [Pirellulales bacterium]|jgi:HEAT repeat protein